ANIASASSGGLDAFVFAMSNNGSNVSADRVNYVGTSGTDKAGGLTVGSDGTVYLVGTTSGTFAGQTRASTGKNNLFVSAISGSGSIAWTQQYGGTSGQSTGMSIAIDANGTSVLDKLGLPRGTLTLDQTVDLASQSTLRPGDSFKIALQGTGARTAKITIEKGETL